MALPKVTTPTYELVLPSTDKKVKYRPFLVKEEKLLLIAMESENDVNIADSVKQVIKNCTFNEVDVEKLPVFDLEYVFLQIRAKSVGEIVKIKLLCPDDKKTYADVDVDLTKIDVQVDDKHTNKILFDDKRKLGMVLRYPSLSLFGPMKFDEKSNDPKQVFKLIVACIDHIFEGEKVYSSKDSNESELIDFLEQLPQKDFVKVKDFFDTMPQLKHEVEVENPKTKVKSKIVLQGLKDFFVSASPTST